MTSWFLNLSDYRGGHNELHPLPLPMGEVAERSEDGEGELDCNTLSVTFGDSSPRGRAKGLYQYSGADVLRQG